jgi:hypothetical protein
VNEFLKKDPKKKKENMIIWKTNNSIGKAKK